MAASPAHHRDLAYGGDPGLDRIRLGLTWRILERGTRLVAGTRVFEIGFGAGALLRRMLDAGVKVSGCDPDQLGVRLDPRVEAEGDIHRVSLESLDPADLPEPVDLVFGVHVIEHVENIHTVAQASLDVVRPGGHVAFMTPAADSLSAKLFSDAWWLLEDPTHVRFFSATSAHAWLTTAGFEDVRVTRLLTDNLTMEGASLVRLFRPSSRPDGVLGRRSVRWFATAIAPLALVVRLLVPRWRPTMLITARRPDGSSL